MKVLAVLFWVACGIAVISHLAGNPTAINAIIGAGLVALIFTALAALEPR